MGLRCGSRSSLVCPARRVGDWDEAWWSTVAGEGVSVGGVGGLSTETKQVVKEQVLETALAVWAGLREGFRLLPLSCFWSACRGWVVG